MAKGSGKCMEKNKHLISVKLILIEWDLVEVGYMYLLHFMPTLY